MRSTPRCSSTRSWSRSATGRSPTGRSTPRSGSPWTGEKDILGLWAGTGGEGAKFWMSVLTDLRNRGVTRRVLRGLRRAEGPARGGGQRVAADDRADLHHPPDPQHVPAGVQAGLGRAASATSSRSTPRSTPPRPGPRSTSWPTSGATATRRSSGCGTTPGRSSSRSWTTTSRSARCSARTNAIESPERPLPAGGQGPRPLPDRAGRAEVPLPGHPVPRPHRDRPSPMDDALEASPQRVRHHLRRPVPGRRDLLTKRRKHR